MIYSVCMNESIFWYDLETFGLSPFSDRFAQAAGIRTDYDLNIISDPLLIYCRPTDDYLPSPQSCLVTGITPQAALAKGVCEADFIEILNKEFSRPRTVVAGFNNINFDDEFIRNALYRNFFDPYEREYRNGCSRWDILDLVRACHDLRPEGIKFLHKNPSGAPAFKLVYLTEDNNIAQEGAHDAMVDIHATINVAKLIKTKQPRLYNWYFTHRTKESISPLIKTLTHEPILYTCASFTSVYGCTRPIAPLGGHPEISNEIYAFDLTEDASLLKEANPDEILSVPGIIKIALNKCPYIAPIEMLIKLPDVQKRLNINMSEVEKNLAIIKSDRTLLQRLSQSKEKRLYAEESDVDMRIYSDGYTTNRDKINFRLIREAKPQDKLYQNRHFDSDKANKMLFRQVARNWPKYLTDKEKSMWKNFCATRLLQPIGRNLSFDSYMRAVNELLQSMDISGKDKLVLVALRERGESLHERVLS